METLSCSDSMSKRRFPLLDGWRGLAVLLMLVYHLLYDLAEFGVMAWSTFYSAPLNILQDFICCSFIFLAGASTRFSRSVLRRGLITLGAGLLVQLGAAAVGEFIRFGILQFMGTAMLIYAFTGKWLRRMDSHLLTVIFSLSFLLTAFWTTASYTKVSFLYPLGFISADFYSSDYFPLLPWLFLFLLGTVFGGWCLRHARIYLLSITSPHWLTWVGRHSLLVYLLHQPIFYGLCLLIWG